MLPGVKVTNRGKWLRENYGKRRKGYIKLHIAVDTREKKVLSVRVTDEKKHDSIQILPLVGDIDNVEKVIADGAYDSRRIFNHLNQRALSLLLE